MAGPLERRHYSLKSSFGRLRAWPRKESPIQGNGNMPLFDRGQLASLGLRSELKVLPRGPLLSLQLSKNPKDLKRNRGWK